MRIALDSNVLAYADGVNGAERQKIARKILEAIVVEDLVIPAQCLGELYRVLTGKAGWTAQEATDAVFQWRQLAVTEPTTEAVIDGALDLISRHPHQIWDAIVISAAVTAGCRVLLSQDMQDGFVYRGLTIVNPFAERLHPLLASWLEDLPRDPPGAPE